MKKVGLLFAFIALLGLVALTSCKPKAAEPAAETTEQVAPETPAEEAPAEEAPAE